MAVGHRTKKVFLLLIKILGLESCKYMILAWHDQGTLYSMQKSYAKIAPCPELRTLSRTAATFLWHFESSFVTLLCSYLDPQPNILWGFSHLPLVEFFVHKYYPWQFCDHTWCFHMVSDSHFCKNNRFNVSTLNYTKTIIWLDLEGKKIQMK